MRSSKQKEAKRQRLNILYLSILIFVGIALIGYSLIAQDRELFQDMEEYTTLVEQVQNREMDMPDNPYPSPETEQEIIVTVIPWVRDVPTIIPAPIAEIVDVAKESADQLMIQTGRTEAEQTALPKEIASPHPVIETPTPTPVLTATPVPKIGKTGVDLEACKAQNSDFVAWLKIPGTKINYPVVWTDRVDYYLTHTFSGKESKIGTLFSLGKTDYTTPGRNIAVYGHHITTSGGNMFQPLMSYKKKSFYETHKAIYFDTLYDLGEYAVFAVINIKSTDWDASSATFKSSQDFRAFVDRARAASLYDTGIEVNENDHILTLITCDRDYHNPDGRLIVMAVKQ